MSDLPSELPMKKRFEFPALFLRARPKIFESEKEGRNRREKKSTVAKIQIRGKEKRVRGNGKETKLSSATRSKFGKSLLDFHDAVRRRGRSIRAGSPPPPGSCCYGHRFRPPLPERDPVLPPRRRPHELRHVLRAVEEEGQEHGEEQEHLPGCLSRCHFRVTAHQSLSVCHRCHPF